MNVETLFFIFVSVIGAAAAIVQIIQYLEQRRDRVGTTTSIPLIPLARRGGIDGEGPVSLGTILSDSELIGPFELTREKIIAHVHQRYEPKYSSGISAKFDELNNRKRGKGFEGYFPGQRYRPITPPIIRNGSLEIGLTPLNYAFVALMKDELSNTDSGELVQAELSRTAARLPKGLVSNDHRFNANNINLLGTEVCLITSDGFTLLRKRGKHVLTGRYKWDVSVSGHPTLEDVTDNRLDLADTITREARNEIGEIDADQRRIIFTGFHRNILSGDMDILALWPIENNAEQIRQKITAKYPSKQTRIFRTTRPALEKYVWDTDNLLVEFSGSAILHSLQMENVNLDNFLPEALVCLELALLTRNQPTLGIGLPNRLRK